MFKRNRQIQKIDQLIVERNFDEAWSLLNELLNDKSTDSTLLLQGAILYFEQKNYAESMQWLERGIGVDPDNPILHLAKGEVHYQLKEYDSALTSLKIALDLSPGHPKADYLLGLCYLATDREEVATLHFERVSRNDPDFLQARLLTIAEAGNMKNS